MKRIVPFLVVCAVALFTADSARAALLLANGDFEAGLAGWTVTNQLGGSGSFYSNGNGAPAPVFGLSTPVNAGGGLLNAVSDQGGPGAHALTQAFVVPLGTTSVTLSFDMFLDDYSGASPIVDPAGLDFTAFPNQHARIEILTFGASALSTAPIDIVASVLVPLPAPAFAAGSNPWVGSPLFDLTAALVPGGSYQIRFAEVDNSGNFIFGVDNVVLDATAAAVPEPTSIVLFGLSALGGVLGAMRRRKVAV